MAAFDYRCGSHDHRLENLNLSGHEEAPARLRASDLGCDARAAAKRQVDVQGVSAWREIQLRANWVQLHLDTAVWYFFTKVLFNGISYLLRDLGRRIVSSCRKGVK
ncbi:hypothetical protein GCM10009109_10420 [Marinobacterium sediminicola]